MTLYDLLTQNPLPLVVQDCDREHFEIIAFRKDYAVGWDQDGSPVHLYLQGEGYALVHQGPFAGPFPQSGPKTTHHPCLHPSLAVLIPITLAAAWLAIVLMMIR